VFSERLWNLSRQSGMSRKLARGAVGPSVFDALFPVNHRLQIIAESQ
jgi:hypothetical protein